VLPHSTQRESLYSCLQNVSCESSSLANKWPTSAGTSEIYILYRSGEGLVRYSVQHGAPAVSALMQYGAGDYFTVQLLGVRGIFLAETSGLSRQGRAGGSQVSQRTNHTNTYRHEHMQNRTCLKTCAFVFACACTQNLT